MDNSGHCSKIIVGKTVTKTKTKQSKNMIETLTKEMRTYKTFLINGILDFQQNNEFTRDELESKTIRTLERIYDTIGL